MPTPRRTQAERSATTRAVLIDAAVDSLVERGWAATTAVEVCARTGLTRGALAHHFPSRPSLLAAALDSVCSDLVEAVASVSGEPRTLRDAIEVTWACTGDRRFKAVIEAWLAAANDPDLQREIGPVIARVSKLVSPDSALRDVFADAALANTDARLFYLTARETLLGLALGRAMTGGQALPHETDVVDRLLAESERVR